MTTPPTEIVGAAAVLEHAAELAPLSSPALQPGQYLLVQSRIEYVVTYDADIVDGAPYSSPRSESEAAWLVTSSHDTYIPEDRNGEWVRVFNADTSVIAWYGPEAEALAADWERQVQQAEPIVQRVQGGLIEPFEVGYTIGSPEYYAAMPRDPQALLDWYWDYNGLGDEERATEILAQVLIQDLELNAAPADLRASMFRALSLVEGVAVQFSEGDVTTLSIDVRPRRQPPRHPVDRHGDGPRGGQRGHSRTRRCDHPRLGAGFPRAHDHDRGRQRTLIAASIGSLRRARDRTSEPEGSLDP